MIKNITKTKIKISTAVMTIAVVGGLFAGMAVIISRNINADTKVAGVAEQKIVSNQNEENLSPADELKKIKEKIKEKGAKWEAGETDVSKLSPEERKKRVVAKDKLDAMIPKVAQITSPVTTLSPTLDWRNSNGQGFITPVKNQGSCGSCWDFAATATGESAILLKNKTPYSQSPIDLSEQVMLSCSGAGTCNGGSPASASNYLANTGLPSESCYPYTATDGSCSSACANWQTSASKIGNAASIKPDVTSIKNALDSYGPLVATMAVYNDFFSYRTGVYSYVTGALAGYHAVSIVGYDDINQCLIVKNSWGTGWGESGFFRIAYSEVGGMSNFAYSVIAYNTTTPVNPPAPDTTAPTVSLTAPTNGSTVSATVAMNASASDNVGVSKVEFYQGSTLLYSDTSSPYSFNWNTLTVSNGIYNLSAKAYDAAGNSGASPIVAVTVNNVPDYSNPAVTITSPASGSLLPAKGTVTISTTATDDVGVTKIEILLDNKIKITCSSQSVCSYNLNTTSLKKGTHTISAKAYDASGKTDIKSITVTK
jgi:C1A family cysteine protease